RDGARRIVSPYRGHALLKFLLGVLGRRGALRLAARGCVVAPLFARARRFPRGVAGARRGVALLRELEVVGGAAGRVFEHLVGLRDSREGGVYLLAQRLVRVAAEAVGVKAACERIVCALDLFGRGRARDAE